MSQYPVLCIALLLAGADNLLAQAASVTTQDATTRVRYTIEQTIDSVSETAVFMNGEERGGGGGREIKSRSKVVFEEEQTDAGTVRQYVEGSSHTTMPGRDGEPVELDVVMGVAGEDLLLFEDDRGLVVLRGGAEGEELSRFEAMGIPKRTTFAGMTPDQAVKVGDKFAMPKGFFEALGRLEHPIRPARDAAAERPRGRQPQGGDRAAGGFAGRQGGMRGMRGMGGGGRMAGGELMRALSSAELKGELQGEVIGIENGIAKIKLSGTRTANGDPADFGMGGAAGMFGGRGRGGRGGEQQAPQMESSIELELKLAGELWIDTNTHRMQRLVLEGNGTSNSLRSGSRGEMDFEMESAQEATFRIAIQVEPAAAKTGEAADKDGER